MQVAHCLKPPCERLQWRDPALVRAPEKGGIVKSGPLLLRVVQFSIHTKCLLDLFLRGISNFVMLCSFPLSTCPSAIETMPGT